MYTRLELMIVNGLVDAPVYDKLKYIYRLRHINTGYYYIGQTKNLKNRIREHFESITDIAKGANVYIESALHFHKVIAPIISDGYSNEKKTKKLTKFITESFEVTVLALTGDTDAANIVEKHYIKKGESLNLCLNTMHNGGII